MKEQTPKISTRVIRCPGCRRSTRYDTSNPHRPFCSERCKNSDIVSWAEGNYKLPGPPLKEDEIDSVAQELEQHYQRLQDGFDSSGSDDN